MELDLIAQIWEQPESVSGDSGMGFRLEDDTGNIELETGTGEIIKES